MTEKTKITSSPPLYNKPLTKDFLCDQRESEETGAVVMKFAKDGQWLLYTHVAFSVAAMKRDVRDYGDRLSAEGMLKIIDMWLPIFEEEEWK